MYAQKYFNLLIVLSDQRCLCVKTGKKKTAALRERKGWTIIKGIVRNLDNLEQCLKKIAENNLTGDQLTKLFWYDLLKGQPR